MRAGPGNQSRPPVRWWPAIVILALMLGLLAYLWLGDLPSQQNRVTLTFPTLFFGGLFLVLWLVFFSRLPGRTRLRIFLAVALVTAAVLLSIEIKGVDGNLVPIVGFRWSGDRAFDPTTGTAGVTNPGPNDFPQFYGPDRNAVLPGPRLARDWNTQPPREIWRREVGEGWSSFAVVGNAAVTMEQRGDQEVVVRYDLRSGEQIWVHSDAAPFDTTVGGRGPRATPTIADGRVYAMGSTGLLTCLELGSGALVWQRRLLDEYQTRQPDWGMPASPLIVDDLVVVPLGFYGQAVVAHQRETGAPVWKAAVENGSYSTPILTTLAGRRQLMMINRGSVTAHEPESGELLWTYDWPEPGERVTPPLLMGDDRILVSAGYGVGSRLLQIRKEGTGLAVDEIWRSPRLKSKFAPTVVHEGVVYGLDDGVLVALDPGTGERLWKRGRYGHGQLLLVGDLLLIQAEKGDVVLVEATPEEHRELTRFTAFDSKTWNPPALSGRYLLVRNNLEAACYELPIDGAAS
jgi:outer membrane protein assembly factor BamB